MPAELPEKLTEWVDRIHACRTRYEAAVVYHEALDYEAHVGTVPWTEINRAIIDRWSLSALNYIKGKAWKI